MNTEHENNAAVGQSGLSAELGFAHSPMRLDPSSGRDVWLAFERLYPSVAANEHPAAFAGKLKAAYAVIFSTDPCSPRPPYE